MAEVSSPGVMVGSMREIIMMIRNRAMECLHGLTIGNMMDSGSMVNSMD
jgi:hypothetical protein